MQQQWRSNAIAHLNRTGGYSRTLAHSCTDWPYLLLELLSQAAESGHFQVPYYTSFYLTSCSVFINIDKGTSSTKTNEKKGK